MKKILFISLFIFGIISSISCDSKRNLEKQVETLKEKVESLTTQKDSLESSLSNSKTNLSNKNTKIDNLEKELNQQKADLDYYKTELENLKSQFFLLKKVTNKSKGSLIENTTINGHTVLRRNFVDVIQVNMAYESIGDIYDKYIDGTKIGRFNNKDSILLTEYILIDSKILWFKVCTNGLTGYFKVSDGEKDWYKDDSHLYKEEISTSQSTFIVRKTNQKHMTSSYKSVNFYSIPDSNTKEEGTFNKNESVTITAYILNDNNYGCDWCYITNGKLSGWISTKDLNDGRGGPAVYTPESELVYYLIFRW